MKGKTTQSQAEDLKRRLGLPERRLRAYCNAPVLPKKGFGFRV